MTSMDRVCVSNQVQQPGHKLASSEFVESNATKEVEQATVIRTDMHILASFKDIIVELSTNEQMNEQGLSQQEVVVGQSF